MSEYYMINDVARLLRISTETVRFYEKRKIVTPIRDCENGYRYYSFSDIRILQECRKYQNMGFSLDEIVKIFFEKTEEEVEEMLEVKKNELRIVSEKNQRAMDRITGLHDAAGRIRQNYGKYYIQDSPRCLFAEYSTHVLADRNAMRHPFWDLVSDQFNLFMCAVSISSDIAKDPEFVDKMRVGYSIDPEDAKRFGLEADAYLKEIKSRRSVYATVHAMPLLNYEALEPVYQWMERHNLKMEGDIFAWSRKTVFNKGTDFRLYEVWIPIENE